MLELKFAIYYRAASLSQATVLAEEYHWPDQAFFIYSPLTKSISNSEILQIITFRR